MSNLDASASMRALAGLAANQPLVQAAVKYWWLMIPSGIAMWSMLRGQKITTGSALSAFATSFGPIIPLIMLSEMLSKQNEAAPAGPPPAPTTIGGHIKDASFVPVQNQGYMPGPVAGTGPNFSTPSRPFPTR